jgi:hypothetical protein
MAELFAKMFEYRNIEIKPQKIKQADEAEQAP